MIMPMLEPNRLNRRPQNIPAEILTRASEIVDDIRMRGRLAVEEYAQKFDNWDEHKPIIFSPADCMAALEAIPPETRRLIESAATRIRRFAKRQRESLTDFELDTGTGIVTGMHYLPVKAAGCYAPGGRYPLVSSVLMTVIPACAAGVSCVTLATPAPSPVMLAAAAVAGANQVVALGGVQAIATLALGADITQPCDMIVGPGNQWVTAAKQIIMAERGIDFLAGPSELMIIADDTANPAWLAADLLAQAEHDTAAVPILVTDSSELAKLVQRELDIQLSSLPQPNQATARSALLNGAMTLVGNIHAAAVLANQLAPEHLQIITADAAALAKQCTNYGGIFIGPYAAEVFGDYGIGPNHTLPTSGTARFNAGLSVSNFLKPRTFIRAAETKDTAYETLISETAALARLENLEAHARSAEQRYRIS